MAWPCEWAMEPFVVGSAVVVVNCGDDVRVSSKGLDAAPPPPAPAPVVVGGVAVVLAAFCSG